MSESYDEWLEKAEKTIRKFTKTALEVHKVHVDIDEFIEWATNENVAVTGFTRGDFANLILEKQELKKFAPRERPDPSRAEVKQTMQRAKGMDLSEIWEPYLRRPKSAICPIFRQTN
jgi:hypothetical protein